VLEVKMPDESVQLKLEALEKVRELVEYANSMPGYNSDYIPMYIEQMKEILDGVK
jgi:hypothetical protein